MAALVIAAAGSALGGAVLGTGVVALGLTGNAIGYLAGSLLASAFTPAQKSQGPRLNDLQVSSSAYGTPIPFVFGMPRVAGQVVWASPKREISTTTSQGKGGGGSEYTSFSYEVDLLIELSDNVISGIARVWRDGALVANYNTGADAATITASIASAHWSRFTVYTGDAAQLPDPDYEAAVGSANAPAYRGRGTVFIKSLQLGSGGNLPNLTFEVVGTGTPAFIAWDSVDAYAPAGFVFTNQAKTGQPTSASAAPRLKAVLGHTTGKWYFEIAATGTAQLLNWWGVVGGAAPNIGRPSLDYTAGQFAFIRGNGQQASSTDGFGGSSLGTIANNTVVGVALDLDAAESVMSVYFNNVLIWAHAFEPDEKAEMFPSEVFDSTAVAHTLRTEAAEFTYSPPPGYEAWGDTSSQLITPEDTSVQETVDAVLARTGIPTALVDTSALAAITQPMRALAVAQVASARTVLDMLGSAYFFTASLSDKIYFRPRGGAPAATLAYVDMAWVAGGDTPPESLAIRAANELEVPAQMALTYSNVDGDYQTDTQYSDRLLTGQDSTSATQVPLAFTAAEAKQIVDAMVMDGYVRSFSTQITLGLPHAHLEPGDVVLATGEATSQYRLFLTQRSDADGVLTFDCVLDDASVLSQAGTTSGGTGSQTTVAAVSTTTLELLDIPLLRDADDRTGHLVAIKGNAANWASAGLYVSFDDVSYTQIATVSDQAVIGTCSTTLGAWSGGNVWDLVSTLTVNVGLGELVSYTEADVLNGAAPGYLIGEEIVYAQTATLVSPGVYTLSRFLRGRRGTEWAMASHAANERFVALSTTGLRFVPMDASELGRLRYYKAASAGQRLSDVAAKQITPLGVNQEPFAGVNARANRDTTDTALTWDRRTRLSTRITGPLAWSNPVGESPESYEVDVFTDGTFTTVARTLTTSTPAVTYTAALQVTDFGSNQTVLYLRIYQLSATVGRGYALQATV